MAKNKKDGSLKGFVIRPNRNRFDIHKGNFPVKGGFATEHIAKMYVKMLNDTKPYTFEEKTIVALLCRAGHSEVEFRQRFKHGKDYVLIKSSMWKEVDELTLKKIKEVNPTVEQHLIADDDGDGQGGRPVQRYLHHIEINHDKFNTKSTEDDNTTDEEATEGQG